jgi:hypothetical protein
VPNQSGATVGTLKSGAGTGIGDSSPGSIDADDGRGGKGGTSGGGGSAGSHIGSLSGNGNSGLSLCTDKSQNATTACSSAAMPAAVARDRFQRPDSFKDDPLLPAHSDRGRVSLFSTTPKFQYFQRDIQPFSGRILPAGLRPAYDRRAAWGVECAASKTIAGGSQ